MQMRAMAEYEDEMLRQAIAASLEASMAAGGEGAPTEGVAARAPTGDGDGAQLDVRAALQDVSEGTADEAMAIAAGMRSATREPPAVKPATRSGLDDEEAMLQAAIAMSLQEGKAKVEEAAQPSPDGEAATPPPAAAPAPARPGPKPAELVD